MIEPWWTKALCAGIADATYADNDPWFPEGGNHTPQNIRRICADCPVKTECLTAVMDYERGRSRNGRHGFQGGTTPDERAKLDPTAPRASRSLNINSRLVRDQMYQDGATDAEISAATGVPPKRVRAWRTLNRLPPSPREQEQCTEETRHALYAQGLSDGEIGRRTGVSADAIAYWRLRNKLPAHGAKRAATLGDEADNRYELYKLGYTDKQIGARTGRDPDTIRRWRRKYDLPPVSTDTASYAEKLNKVRALTNRGLNTREVAAQLGYPHTTVRRMRWALTMQKEMGA